MCCSEIIDAGLLILSKYEWLLNASVKDHFLNGYWKRIPSSWQVALLDVDIQDFVFLLDDKCHTTRVWPLSLLVLRAAVANLTIPRKLKPEEKCFPSKWLNICGNMHTITATRNNNSETLNSSEESNSRGLDNSKSLSSNNTRVHNAFKKKVKPKKFYEIKKLSEVVAATADSMNCKHVIDIGSGVGHLARRLAYDYGLSVCCIESQPILSNQAKRLDIQMETTLRKHCSEFEMSLINSPVHLNLTLNAETNYEDLIKSINAAFHLERTCKPTFGIVGLHTCGDLAPILLRLLVNCPSIAFINVVGCCFMKLTTDMFSCFPMSNHLLTKTLPTELSYEAREVACHANEVYCQHVRSGNFEDLKVHCFRATLQEIIVQSWPHLVNTNITSVKCTPHMSFQEYCDIALCKLGVRVSEEDLASPKTLQHLSEWKQVVAVGCLRLLLAPLVETVILLDRLLYLREQGLESYILPLFDPSLSPRNHVLTAMKR